MKSSITTTIKSIVALATFTTLLVACNDDTFDKPGNTSGKISYNPQVWNTLSRSRGLNNTRNFSNFSSEKLDGTDMWMITTEEVGIDGSTLGTKRQSESRGETITADNFYTEFATYGYYYTPESYAEAVNGSNALTLFIDGESTKPSESTAYWSTENVHHWPGASYKTSFFAVAPVPQSDYLITENYTLPTTSAERATATEVTDKAGFRVNASAPHPYLDYAVRDAAKDQTDLLLAKNKDVSGAGTYGDAVDLYFNHILTAVKVKVQQSKDPDGAFAKAITSISFVNVKYIGRYFFNLDTWRNASNTKTFTLTLDTPAEKADDGDYHIADGENTFMMMPQTFSSDAVLRVTFNTGKTVDYQLNGGSTGWTPGTSVTYYISDSSTINEYYLEVPTDGIYFSWQGETQSRAVRSYKRTYNYTASTSTKVLVKEEEVKWKTKVTVTSHHPKTGNLDSGWISNQPSGNGAISTAEPCDTARFSSIAAEPYEEKTPDDDILKSQEYQTVTAFNGYHDLATPTGVEASGITTSNCYVVNAPGDYKLPLVTGNARVNGSLNKQAFINSTNSDNYMLNNFVDNIGYDISTDNSYLWYYTSGWYSDYSTVKTAKVIWQDHPGLIRDENIKFTDAAGSEVGRYLSFTIKPADIAAGNVVIGIYSKVGYCMWSWHIWVTPYKPGTKNEELGINGDITLTNNGGGSSTFTEKPLGYVAGTWQHWAKRNADCEFYQVDDQGNRIGKSVTINLTQDEHWFRPETSTYYQWGRKDPFPGIMCSEAGGLDAYKCYQYTYSRRKVYDGSGSDTAKDIIKFYKATEKNSAGGYGSIPQGIRFPEYFYYGTYWYSGKGEYGSSSEDNTYWNLWGCSSNGDKTSSIKTIYDPSPKGYKVPPLQSMPRLTATGTSISNLYDEFDKVVRDDEETMFKDYWNTPYTSHDEYINNFGFKIYTSYMSASGYDNKGTDASTINLLALGHMEAKSGNPFNLGAYFYYYSASANVTSKTQYNNYYINGGYLKGNCGLYTDAYSQVSALGMPVWPIKE